MTDRILGDNVGRFSHEQSGSMQTFVGAETKHQFPDFGIGGHLLALCQGTNQTGCGHYLKALVESDHEFRWNDLTLNSAKLSTLDLSWDRAELTCRINFSLDATARVSLEGG